MVYGPVLLTSCGLLTLSLSSGLTGLFLSAQRRQWLMRFLRAGGISSHGRSRSRALSQLRMWLSGVISTVASAPS